MAWKSDAARRAYFARLKQGAVNAMNGGSPAQVRARHERDVEAMRIRTQKAYAKQREREKARAAKAAAKAREKARAAELTAERKEREKEAAIRQRYTRGKSGRALDKAQARYETDRDRRRARDNKKKGTS